MTTIRAIPTLRTGAVLARDICTVTTPAGPARLHALLAVDWLHSDLSFSNTLRVMLDGKLIYIGEQSRTPRASWEQWAVQGIQLPERLARQLGQLYGYELPQSYTKTG